MCGSKLAQWPGSDKHTEDKYSDLLKVDTGRPYWVDAVFLRIFFVVTYTMTGILPLIKKTLRTKFK